MHGLWGASVFQCQSQKMFTRYKNLSFFWKLDIHNVLYYRPLVE
jgi:hypothetical protein